MPEDIIEVGLAQDQAMIILYTDTLSSELQLARTLLTGDIE